MAYRTPIQQCIDMADKLHFHHWFMENAHRLLEEEEERHEGAILRAKLENLAHLDKETQQLLIKITEKLRNGDAQRTVFEAILYETVHHLTQIPYEQLSDELIKSIHIFLKS